MALSTAAAPESVGVLHEQQRVLSSSPELQTIDVTPAIESLLDFRVAGARLLREAELGTSINSGGATGKLSTARCRDRSLTVNIETSLPDFPAIQEVDESLLVGLVGQGRDLKRHFLVWNSLAPLVRFPLTSLLFQRHGKPDNKH